MRKQQVDEYSPGCGIPGCKMMVTFLGETHGELAERIVLKGARDPFDFFTVVCTTEAEGEYNACRRL